MNLKPTHGLVVRDWKQDIINLIQFPRPEIIPTASPYALKLETWLRMTKLNYVNVSNELTKGSSKGQIPFIEVNGRQFADSNLIIDHLSQMYNVSIDRNLNTKERAEARALTVLIEESLIRVLIADRSRNFAWLASDQGLAHYLGGIKKFVFQKIVIKKIQASMKSRSHVHGYGRLTLDELDEVAKKDLTALSNFLGDKRFLFGDRPSTVDATLFGTLAQFVFTPINSDKIRPFIEQNTPNLVEFVNRIKAEYWPDWEALTKHHALNVTDIKPATVTTTTTTVVS